MGETDNELAGTEISAPQYTLRGGALVSDLDLELAHRASLVVRQKCNQHKCPNDHWPHTSCGHPNHRRDVDYLRHCLQSLGLQAP